MIFVFQDQKGLAEEEVWGEIWLPHHFSQHGEILERQTHNFQLHITLLYYVA